MITVHFTKVFTEASFLGGLTFPDTLRFTDADAAAVFASVLRDRAENGRVLQGCSGSSDWTVELGSVRVEGKV